MGRGVYVTLSVPCRYDFPSAQGLSAADQVREDGTAFRRAADACGRVADVVDALEADGWSISRFVTLLFAHHPGVRTKAATRRRLAALGVGPGEARVEEGVLPVPKRPARESPRPPSRGTGPSPAAGPSARPGRGRG